jgi:hypothetical protein
LAKMRQIQSTIVGIIALIILFFIISQARRISNPFPFTIIGVLMVHINNNQYSKNLDKRILI